MTGGYPSPAVSPDADCLEKTSNKSIAKHPGKASPDLSARAFKTSNKTNWTLNKSERLPPARWKLAWSNSAKNSRYGACASGHAAHRTSNEKARLGAGAAEDGKCRICRDVTVVRIFPKSSLPPPTQSDRELAFLSPTPTNGFRT